MATKSTIQQQSIAEAGMMLAHLAQLGAAQALFAQMAVAMELASAEQQQELIAERKAAHAAALPRCSHCGAAGRHSRAQCRKSEAHRWGF